MNEGSHKDTTVISPVAKTYQSKLGLPIIGIVLLVSGYVIFKEEHNHKAVSQPPQANLNIQTTIQPPTLTLSQHDIDKLKAAMQTWHTDTDVSHKEDVELDKLTKMRLVAPVLVYSGDNPNNIHLKSNTGTVLGGNDPQDPNSQFMAQVNNPTPSAKATRIVYPETLLTQGNIINATLETRIVSDLPGMVRAITSEDVYSEDDSQILIPKGSRLIGQYSSGIAQGQNRIFIVWQRLIRPDHIDVQLDSPGTDPLGAEGLEADGIDHHFFEQFGTATLLSLIGAGAANAGVNPSDQYNSQASYREAIAQSFSQSAQNSLQATGAIKPTLYANQGDKISVFVARDLDFHDALANGNAP